LISAGGRVAAEYQITYQFLVLRLGNIHEIFEVLKTELFIVICVRLVLYDQSGILTAGCLPEETEGPVEGPEEGSAAPFPVSAIVTA
jgi:hypothetical protein